MFRKIWDYLTYRAFDRNGMLIMLMDRPHDEHAFSQLNVSAKVVDQVLTAVCESFVIDESQKYQLRPEDDLADIYGTINKYGAADILEYETLTFFIKRLIGEFNMNEISSKDGLTIGELIEFVDTRLSSQSKSDQK